jgi:hypothetical protein
MIMGFTTLLSAMLSVFLFVQERKQLLGGGKSVNSSTKNDPDSTKVPSKQVGEHEVDDI